MKKTVKNVSRLVFALLLLFSIFQILNVRASDIVFKVTNLELKEKSANVVVNRIGLVDGELVNDITVKDVNDYVVYNVTLKNNGSEDVTIKSISDTDETDFLDYIFDGVENQKIGAGEEKTFTLTIKYSSISDGLVVSNKTINFNIISVDKNGNMVENTITNANANKTVSNVDNPKTGDSAGLFIFLGVISCVGLIITINTNNKKTRVIKSTLVVVGGISSVMIPLNVNATPNVAGIKNNVVNVSAQLLSSYDVQDVINEITSEYDEEYDDYTYNTVVYFKRGTQEQYNAVKDIPEKVKLVSTDDSLAPVYMWYDKDTETVYYYSTMYFISLNEDCNRLFSQHHDLKEIDLYRIDTSKVVDMEEMFYNCTSLEELDLSHFDTSSVTNMRFMFAGCSLLKELDLSSFDTSNVTDMGYMFQYCSGLEEINLSSFNTSNVTDMTTMFGRCESLKELNLSNFDTSKVEYQFGGNDTGGMFGYCKSLKELDLSNFDTSNLIEFKKMFMGCSNLEKLNISGFDASSAYTFESMFEECDKLEKINVSIINTSNVSNMKYMFYGCDILEEVDLSSFDTISAESMFLRATNLKTIYVNNSVNVIAGDDTFNQCANLVGGSGTSFDSNHIDSTYARIDDPSNNAPGYFTLKAN